MGHGVSPDPGMNHEGISDSGESKESFPNSVLPTIFGQCFQNVTQFSEITSKYKHLSFSGKKQKGPWNKDFLDKDLIPLKIRRDNSEIV